MKRPLRILVTKRGEVEGILDAEGTMIVETDSGNDRPNPEEAAFIVAAVNAYEPDQELAEYRAMPPKRTGMVPIRYAYRGQGEPLPYPNEPLTRLSTKEAMDYDAKIAQAREYLEMV